MTPDRANQSLAKALEDLRAERDRIDNAIDQLQGFIGELPVAPSTGRAPRVPAAKSNKPTRFWSDASRQAAAERMRRYWAARRKDKGKGKGKGKEKAPAAAKPAPKRSTKGWTAAARRAAAERSRKYWAERRKASSR
jgi:hypothetical protein